MSSQSASWVDPSSVVTLGTQSSIVDLLTISLLRFSAPFSVRNPHGSTKSRSGSPDPSTSRTTSPCWRALINRAS